MPRLQITRTVTFTVVHFFPPVVTVASSVNDLGSKS